MAKRKKTAITITDEMWNKINRGEVPQGCDLSKLPISVQIEYWKARKFILEQEKETRVLTNNERADIRRAKNFITQAKEFKRQLGHK